MNKYVYIYRDLRAAWHRMSNVDYWQSPLPKSWLGAAVPRQILRERDFNMTPVFHISGHILKNLKQSIQTAKKFTK
ncbi:hypothetical protein NXV24_26180 [Bacteroides thetaiotaomicron]|uniref:alpha-N-acetylglucosaminidase TIM-barrel domain-containing protein n=1 Tax=Bacteroides thetaiotaomicron TaxID=818 RepID=UPI00216635CB|nr:alpha-N-acetylglucosaminidase TIM-barrel domain-containing protein [Bacteroides thetaiotaomicron]MCS2399782.1 hypothetical protein [Bacteroides thetaiotaomicron]